MLNGMSIIEILKLFAPYIALELCFKIFCLIKLSRDRVKYLPKWGWVLVILFINTLGWVFYLTIGRKKD